jgi:glycosyltransferase involved in cell wall biosynthesis
LDGNASTFFRRISEGLLPGARLPYFDQIERRSLSALRKAPRPRIVIDGYFFQIAQSGIARVWLNLFRVWSNNGFSGQIIVLDRAGTAPRIEGVHYVKIDPFSYERASRDSILLERLCRRFDADLFVSTYYTTPLKTPSVFFGHDMIPEVIGFDLSEPVWVEKKRAIEHASAHIMVSKNSALDLERLVPSVPAASTIVAPCGVDPIFKPRSQEQVASFRRSYGLEKPYLLLVGDRTGGPLRYKNGELAFKAFTRLPNPDKYMLVCVGGHDPLEENLRDLVGAKNAIRLSLTDDELACAYSGAHAAIYPSLYEGFGLPVVEAMACHCPVITCANSSLIEVAGDAALFADERNPDDVAQKVIALESDDLKRKLIARGVKQAAKFDFETMAETIQSALLNVHTRLTSDQFKRPDESRRAVREQESHRELRRPRTQF